MTSVTNPAANVSAGTKLPAVSEAVTLKEYFPAGGEVALQVETGYPHLSRQTRFVKF